MKKHRLKNNLIFFILIIVISSCNYQDIEIKDVKDVKLAKTNTKEINLNVLVEINNPNNYKIKISEYNFDIKINGQRFKLKDDNADIKIPKNFSSTIPVSIKMTKYGKGIFSLQSLFIFGKIIAKRSAEIEAQGFVKARIFLISKKIFVHEKRTFKF